MGSDGEYNLPRKSLLCISTSIFLFPGPSLCHDVDGDAVLHLCHRGDAALREHCPGLRHRHRKAQQLQERRTGLHDAVQVKKESILDLV